MKKLYKVIIISILIVSLISFSSCQIDNLTNNILTEKSILTDENILDSKPLKILLHSEFFNGVRYSSFLSQDHWHNLLNEISNESKNKFGYSVEFFSCKNAGNEYLLFLESGLSGSVDLIFTLNSTSFRLNEKESNYLNIYDFWNDDFIKYYKNLTPYLQKFCPDVFLNMQKYDYIMEMVSRENKIYALYAGVPQIFTLSLLVKKETLDKCNIQSVENFDELYYLMEIMYGKEDISKNNKILISPHTLMEYAINKAGYYPVTKSYGDFKQYNVFCKINDITCKPYLIEDTNILDVFLNEFNKFFESSYFLFFNQHNQYDSIYSKNGIDMVLVHNYFEWVLRFLLNNNTTEHVLNNYSLFLFDTDLSIITNNLRHTQLILVPDTCEQPEKALGFVQWLFTNDKVGELLTFGTDKGKYPNYWHMADGNIAYYELGYAIHLFNGLIANFSSKLYPFNNKTFDRTDKYMELAQRAILPPLYREIEIVHNYKLSLYRSAVFNFSDDLQERTDFIENTINRLFDGYSITADEMKNILSDMTDNRTILDKYQGYIRNIFE